MSNRGFPTANPYPSAVPVHGVDFYRPTYLPYQYQANAHRSAAKQQSTNDSAAANLEQHNEQAKRMRVEKSRNGGYVPRGNERLRQVPAKAELYTDVNAPERAQPAQPLAEMPSQRQLETVQPRLNAMQRREQQQAAEAERAERAERSVDAQVVRQLTRAAAQRQQNASVDAATAEKAKYADNYKSGNEEAYAHVEALQTSMRGYEDTSKATIEKLRAQNNREASRRAFMTPY
jgi:hypothetical protein